jgi:hypothetical protein
MVNKNFGKMLIIACLLGGLIMSIWAMVLKNNNKLTIAPTERFLPTETLNKYGSTNTSTPQKTIAHNMGTILIIHSEAGKVSLVRDEYPYHIIHPVWQPDGQGFIADAPELGKEIDHAMFIPTVFDLSGNIINQITVENSEVASSWIANDISIIQE